MYVIYVCILLMHVCIYKYSMYVCMLYVMYVMYVCMLFYMYMFSSSFRRCNLIEIITEKYIYLFR